MIEKLIATENTPSAVAARYAESGLSWRPVLLFLPARLVFAWVAQGLVVGLLALRDSSDAWRDAAAWWPVYSTITDILCLLSLVWLTRREGLTLTSLFGAWGKSAVRQLAWTPAYLLAVAPGVALAAVITQLFYGSPLTPIMTVVNLPPAGALYGQIIWPVIWVVAEELVYLGFLLPRIEALSGKTWVAIVVVIFFWGLQHLAIPWIADGTYLV